MTAGLRHEHFHYLPAQVREHLVDALEMVDELDPPADLRPLVFDKALTLLSAKNLVIEQVGTGVQLPPMLRG